MGQRQEPGESLVQLQIVGANIMNSNEETETYEKRQYKIIVFVAENPSKKEVVSQGCISDLPW